MDVWDVLVTAGSIGFILCLMPQLWHTLRRRTAEDFSVPYLILVLAASALVFPYMLHQREYIFAASQAVNLIVWGTVLYFRLFPSRRGSKA